MGYLKRLLDIFIFMLVWIGLPHSIVWYTGMEGFYTLILVTWLAALFVVYYLNDTE